MSKTATIIGHNVIRHCSVLVKRSWEERLFTRPWRPWQSHRWTKPIVGPKECLIIGNNLHCGEEVYQELMKHCEPKP